MADVTPARHTWHMAVTDLMGPPRQTIPDRLRGDLATRPVVDPGLGWGLRDWLEDAISEPLSCISDYQPPIRVTKERINQVLLCEAHYATPAPRRASIELARGGLLDVLFRQWVTTGAIEDPITEGIDSLEASGSSDLAQFVQELDADRRQDLVDELAEHLLVIKSGWPSVNRSWLARTQEKIEVSLGGGRVVLTGVLDLALGQPASSHASVCVVEVKSGKRRLEHRGDLHYYALLETLRSGAPPFRAATYYTRTGELDAENVNDDVLSSAMQRTVAALVKLCRLGAGAEPARIPNPLCAWCHCLGSCPPGQHRAGTDRPLTEQELEEIEVQL